MAGLDPAIPLEKAPPCQMIGIAGSSPAMTAGWSMRDSFGRVKRYQAKVQVLESTLHGVVPPKTKVLRKIISAIG
jgi:hypothetical protein